MPCDCDYCTSKNTFPKENNELRKQDFIIGIVFGVGITILGWAVFHMAMYGECICY